MPGFGNTQQSMEDALALWIITCNLPTRVVEQEGFRDFCKQMNPGFTVPYRRKLVGDTIPKLFCGEIAKLRNELKGVEYVHLTTDGWSSRAQRSFVSVTGAFIDKGWVAHERLLDLKPFEGEHTAISIAEGIK